MEPHYIKFERMGQLISIAAMKRNSLSLSDLMLNDQEVTFHVIFSDYVKSQIHLNIVTGLFGRDIREYKYALDYLYGKVSKNDTVIKVLGYYYNDMFAFLANNQYNCHLQVEIDIEELKSAQISFESAKSQLDNFLTDIQNRTFDEVSDIVNTLPFAEVLDYVDSLDSLASKKDSTYTMVYLNLLEKEIKQWNSK